MYVESVTESEVRITLEVTVDLVNGLDNDDFDARQLLIDSGYSNAPDASPAALERLLARIASLGPLIQTLPNLDADTAIDRVNTELAALTIAPLISDHGGVGPHIHWTPVSATFDDQAITDSLMALALELCDNGTIRFGRCAADGCDDLFYDGTRNRSRRFCSNPRCASRTHTADHRARQKAIDTS